MSASRLREFCESHNLSHSEFGKLAKCSAAMVGMLCRAERKPGLALAVRIEKVTATWSLGPIRPWEWVRDEEGRAA